VFPGAQSGVGSFNVFRDAVENGGPSPLAIEEHSHAAMANAYEAGADGAPSRSFSATSGRPAEVQSEHIARHLSVHRRTSRRLSRRSGPTARRHGQARDRAGNIMLMHLSACGKRSCLPQALDRHPLNRRSTILDRAAPTAVILPA